MEYEKYKETLININESIYDDIMYYNRHLEYADVIVDLCIENNLKKEELEYLKEEIDKVIKEGEDNE